MANVTANAQALRKKLTSGTQNGLAVVSGDAAQLAGLASPGGPLANLALAVQQSAYALYSHLQ